MMQVIKAFKKNIYLSVAICLLLLIGAGIYYQFSQPVKYNQLDNYSFKPQHRNINISFKKPVQMTELSKATDQMELEHIRKSIRGTGHLSSYIAFAVLPTSQELTNDDMQNITEVLSSSKQVFYMQETSSIKQFVQDRLDAGASVTYMDAKIFTSDNIKKNVWQVDFQTKANPGHQFIKGKAVMFVNKDYYVFFMLCAPDKTWQKNTDIWNEISNSIKISS